MYKQFAELHESAKIGTSQETKYDHRTFDNGTWYSKSFYKIFFNYLDPFMFNFLPQYIKKILFKNINLKNKYLSKKKIIFKYL